MYIFKQIKDLIKKRKEKKKNSTIKWITLKSVFNYFMTKQWHQCGNYAQCDKTVNSTKNGSVKQVNSISKKRTKLKV